MEVEYNDPVVQEQGRHKNCNDYGRTKLLMLRHYEGFEMWVRRGASIFENQFTFMLGSSAT